MMKTVAYLTRRYVQPLKESEFKRVCIKMIFFCLLISSNCLHFFSFVFCKKKTPLSLLRNLQPFIQLHLQMDIQR